MKSIYALAPVCALLFSAACSQSPEKLLATANKYHQNKKYKEASILYQKVIAKDKTNAEAYYREGLNLLDDRQPAQAIGYLRRALDLKPDNVDAATKLSEIDLTIYSSNPQKFGQQLADAKDLNGKILAKHPNSFDGLRVAGLIALAEKDPARALDLFSKANTVKPYSRELVGWYAETLVATQKRDEALALIRDMLNHDKSWGPGYDFLYMQYARASQQDKAEAILRERVANDPKSSTGYVNLANYLIATNRMPEAESVIKKVLDDRKTFPAGREIVGDYYVRNKKYDQALEQYSAGKTEDPKHAVAYQERTVAVYALMGKKDDALQLAKDTASKNPKDNTANEVYASLLLQGGKKEDLTKAVGELKALLQKNPKDANLHLDIARAYYGLGNQASALTDALEAIRLNPRSMGAHFLAGRLYENRGEHAKAIEQSELVLAVDPNNPDVRLVHAQALIGSGNNTKGQAELEDLLARAPKMNDARLQLAGLYLQAKAYDKAKENFEQVWKSDPPDQRGFVGLQTIKLAQGQPEEAVAALQEALDKDPKRDPMRFQLANFQTSAAAALAARKQPDKAKQYAQAAIVNYKELVKNSPKSEELWLRLGVLQRETAQYDASLASFEQASNLNPQSAPAYLNRALLLEAMNKKKEAADYYTKVIGIDPQNTLALNNLAFLTAESGANLDQAMTFATKAQKQVPNSPDVSDTLGYVYLQKNLNSEALQIFKRVVQDQPKNSTFRLHLAMALLKQGDKQGARDEAQKAMETAGPQQKDQIRSFVGQIG